jgi:hypothetical protein
MQLLPATIPAFSDNDPAFIASFGVPARAKQVRSFYNFCGSVPDHDETEKALSP